MRIPTTGIQYYIPEWLLDEWEIRVNADLTGAA